MDAPASTPYRPPPPQRDAVRGGLGKEKAQRDALSPLSFYAVPALGVGGLATSATPISTKGVAGREIRVGHI
jgi:hypothetical protein